MEIHQQWTSLEHLEGQFDHDTTRKTNVFDRLSVECFVHGLLECPKRQDWRCVIVFLEVTIEMSAHLCGIIVFIDDLERNERTTVGEHVQVSIN